MYIKNLVENLSLYFRGRVLAMFLLGISSGFPLTLTSSTFKVWITEVGITIKVVGLLSMVTLPYTLKFLWAPFIDYFSLPYLSNKFGKRRSWLLLVQLLLVLSIILLGYSNPSDTIHYTAIYAFIVAFFSATQDIIIDAFRIELLSKEEQGHGSAMSVFGYRIGMLLTGAGALYLSEYFDWSTTYSFATFGIIIGIITVLLLKENPREPERDISIRDVQANFMDRVIITPFIAMVSRSNGIIIIFFVLCYKLGDSILFSMTNPFLVQAGFSKSEIANIVNCWGLIATTMGAMIGGAIIYSIGITKSLWIGAISQASSNLMYCIQAFIGYDTQLLALTIGVENLSGGLGTAVFIAYLSRLCNKTNYTATQYALYTALSSVGRDLLSAPFGWVISQVGWISFFALTTIISFPGMLFLYILTKKHDNILNYKR